MKTHKLTKGDRTVFIRIGKQTAEMKTKVGENAPTSSKELTPLEANQQVADLIRQGYVAQN